jgi:hypothetical protein
MDNYTEAAAQVFDSLPCNLQYEAEHLAVERDLDPEQLVSLVQQAQTTINETIDSTGSLFKAAEALMDMGFDGEHALRMVF